MNWMRMGAAALLTGACTLLVACGDSVVSDLHPARFVTVGDGFLDAGQDSGKVYTVDNGDPIWVQRIATRYGLELDAESAGGFGYAEGGACVEASSGLCSTARTIKEQVDALLSSSEGIKNNDLVFVSGGMQDIVAAVEEAVGDGKTGQAVYDQAKTPVNDAAKTLADQAIRIFNESKDKTRHILVIGVYNLGNSPWAHNLGLAAQVEDLSVDFNSALSVRLDKTVGGGIHILFFDSATLSNFVYSEPSDFGFDDGKKEIWACDDLISVAPCTEATANTDYGKYIFADNLYMTPRMLNLYADDGYGIHSVYGFMRENW